MNNPLDRVNDCARAALNLGLPLNVKLSDCTPFEKEVVFDLFRSCWAALPELARLELYGDY